MENKNVLLLGGTGAMGAHLSKILANKGLEVYVTTRQNIKELKLDKHIHYIQGNAKDNPFLERELQNRDYHCVVDFMTYSHREFDSRKDILLNATAQYVFLSSSRVYADSITPITEESPRHLDVCNDSEYLSTDEYALAKAREENILRSSAKKNWTIIRPYITYSETRLQLGVMEKESWLYRALHGRKIVFSKDIAQRLTTLTYGNDVAKGIASIIGQKGALGETFHITQPKAISWSKVLSIYQDVIEEVTGKRPEVILTDEAINLKRGIKKWQVKVDRLYDREFDSSKINQFIDTSTFISPEEGLRNCLRSFLNSPKFLSIDWYENILMDKISNEISSYSEMKNLRKALSYAKWRFFKHTKELL